jgi:hypothetical protein
MEFLFHSLWSSYVCMDRYMNYMAKVIRSFVKIFVRILPKIMRDISNAGGVSFFRLEENMYRAFHNVLRDCKHL